MKKLQQIKLSNEINYYINKNNYKDKHDFIDEDYKNPSIFIKKTKWKSDFLKKKESYFNSTKP